MEVIGVPKGTFKNEVITCKDFCLFTTKSILENPTNNFSLLKIVLLNLSKAMFIFPVNIQGTVENYNSMKTYKRKDNICSSL